MTTTTAFIVLCGALLVNGAFLKRPHLDGRIIGGTDGDIEDLPYQLSLRKNGNEDALCGATIISEDWVLTSGNCVYKASNMMFRAGSNSYNSGGSLHQPIEIILHEDPVNLVDYDCALIRVHPPFVFGPGVQPIDLADTEPAAGEEAVVSGWGLDAAVAGPFKEHLQVTTVHISDRETCAFVSGGMICADEGKDGKDICLGDNGGPLVVGGKLAGISLYGGCGLPPYPSRYSNVAMQKDWIKRTAGI